MELGKGEALVSFLEGNGTPSMVERCMIRPPSARLGPITPEERKALIASSPVKGKYDQAIDSESAYEVLQRRMQSGAADGPLTRPHAPGTPEEAPPAAGLGAVLAAIGAMLGAIFGTSRPRGQPPVPRPARRPRSHSLGHQPGRRPDRRRYREVARRQDGQLGRPRHRARDHGWHLAAVSAAGRRPANPRITCLRHIAASRLLRLRIIPLACRTLFRKCLSASDDRSKPAKPRATT